MGDKPVHLNLKGKRFENWVTDSYAYGKGTNPIYKTIPFYTGLHNKKGIENSVLFDDAHYGYDYTKGR